MGFLNIFNKKKPTKNLEENSDKIEKINENQNINKKNNNSNNNNNCNSVKFRLVIQDIFRIKGKGCVVVGIVENNVKMV